MTVPIRVLVVDDSAFMRHAISQILESDANIEVVGTARDGLQALEMIENLHPDVATLDVEMPRLGGLETLQRIMERCPLPVVMVSSSTKEGSSITLSALAMGAVDFVAKPSGPASPNIRQVTNELITKVKAAAGARVRGRRQELVRSASRPVTAAPAAERTPKIVIIGSSTGGPRALYELVPALPRDLDAALLIVQHMPPGFTGPFAERLNEMSSLTIKEAGGGERLEAGLGLLAPGGRHLVVTADGVTRISDGPPVHGVRPSVDVTMGSLAEKQGRNCLGVILTGMGSDGTLGCKWIKSLGGKVIAEDESTCVVFGMPRSVIEAGVVDRVVPLHEMAAAIVEMLPEVGQ